MGKPKSLISKGQWKWAENRYRDGYSQKIISDVLGVSAGVVGPHFNVRSTERLPFAKRAALPPLRLRIKEAYALWDKDE